MNSSEGVNSGDSVKQKQLAHLIFSRVGILGLATIIGSNLAVVTLGSLGIPGWMILAIGMGIFILGGVFAFVNSDHTHPNNHKYDIVAAITVTFGGIMITTATLWSIWLGK